MGGERALRGYTTCLMAISAVGLGRTSALVKGDGIVMTAGWCSEMNPTKQKKSVPKDVRLAHLSPAASKKLVNLLTPSETSCSSLSHHSPHASVSVVTPSIFAARSAINR